MIETLQHTHYNPILAISCNIWYVAICFVFSGMARGGIITDLDFEGFSTRDLADSSLQTWVHHSPAILPQVRTC